MTTVLRAFLPLCASMLVATASARTGQVTVQSAPHDRASQVIAVRSPAKAGDWTVAVGPRGLGLPVQVGADGTISFVVPWQKAGETLAFVLEGGAAPASGVRIEERPGELVVSARGTPVFHYRLDKGLLPRSDIKPEYHRAGYLHPVVTARGTVVTDDYPVQHVHHHGIWSPYTSTSFQGRTPDFWNMGKKTGTVERESVEWTWSGPVHGGFVARHRFVDLSAPQPVTALHETWQVTAYAATTPDAQPLHVFDLLLTHVSATNDPLFLPKYHYGGLGVRGRGEWFGNDQAFFLTSEGETDRVKANARPMRWVHLSGALDSGPAGIAILGHPENFRAPQPVRVHPKEPYVSFTPSEAGDWSIAPGRPYVARYRFVPADGAPDRAMLEALWQGFARPGPALFEATP